jgi:hypothetical protein
MICIMKRSVLTVLAPMLVLGPALAPAEDDGIANERPPMSRAALERHWNVDCTRLAQALEYWSTNPAQVAEAAWLHEARLCAAIHNPPGGDVPAHCPDFSRIGTMLAAGVEPATIRTQLQCAH